MLITYSRRYYFLFVIICLLILISVCSASTLSLSSKKSFIHEEQGAYLNLITTSSFMIESNNIDCKDYRLCTEEMPHAISTKLQQTESYNMNVTPISNFNSKFISIDTISPHWVNDTFTISGKTDLPVGSKLDVVIDRSTFNPGRRPQWWDPWYYHTPNTTFVKYDPSIGNIWSYTLNTTGSYPDEYLIKIKLFNDENISAGAIFNLLSPDENDTNNVGLRNLTSLTLKPVSTQASSPSYPTTKPASLPPIFAIGSFLFAIMLFLITRHWR